jgi:Transglycosylase SLT domain
MSDLDTFVLRYEVDSREAQDRLTRLEQQVTRTSRTFRSAGGGITRFVHAASTELNKVIPGVNDVTRAVLEMAAGFGVASAAIALMIAGVKSIGYAREQYNIRRLNEQTTGIGYISQEDLTRKFQGANVSRAQSQAMFGKGRDFLTAARVDPAGAQAMILQRQLGIPLGSSTQDLFAAIAGKDANTAAAIGKQIGFSRDETDAMRKVGPAAMNRNDLTLEQMKSMEEGDKAAAKLNEDLALLTKNFQDLELQLGQHLLPFLSKFVEVMNDPELEKENKRGEIRLNQAHGFWETLGALAVNMGIRRETPEEHQKVEDARTKPSPEQQKHDQEEKDAFEAKRQEEDRIAREKQDQNDRESRAVALFASAVASFAHAMNPEQARAALIGEYGVRSGLGKGGKGVYGPSIGTGQDAGAALPSGTAADIGQYDEIIAEAHKKFPNVPVDVIRAQMQVESGGKRGAVSEKGATGLMQIMPSNYEHLGIKDPTDPRQSIFGSFQLMDEFLKKSHGDIRQALTYYVGGYDKSKYGPRTAAYPDQVEAARQQQSRGGSGGSGGTAPTPQGQSGRGGSIYATQVNQDIAGLAGVPVYALRSVTKGDMATYIVQTATGLNKTIMRLHSQLDARKEDPNDPLALPATGKQLSQWKYQLQQAENERHALNYQGPKLIGLAQEGEQRQTERARVPWVGEININITEAQDPHGTARRTMEGFKSGTDSFVNNNSSAAKS